jgi:hypothetical protein
MRSLFKEVTNGLDILESKTIAAACMKEFRTNHLSEKQLALISEKGYGVDKKFNQSTLARKFLAWYQHEHGVDVRTSDSPNYEKKVGGRFFVDGFVEQANRLNKDRDLIIEVHGCFWYLCNVTK